MSPTLTIPEPAYKTHEDGQDPAVLLRLSGCQELGGGTLSLDELKRSCKREAENGCDPAKGGSVELGLMLGEDEYERLKAYAKSLTVVYPKRRRHA